MLTCDRCGEIPPVMAHRREMMGSLVSWDEPAPEELAEVEHFLATGCKGRVTTQVARPAREWALYYTGDGLVYSDAPIKGAMRFSAH